MDGHKIKTKSNFKVRHQKHKLFRANDPLLSVLMWGVNFTVSKLSLDTNERDDRSALDPRVGKCQYSRHASAGAFQSLRQNSHRQSEFQQVGHERVRRDDRCFFLPSPGK